MSIGFTVYGISRDCPDVSQAFREKYRLEYGLICDQDGALIERVGLGWANQGTVRGVVAINKDGRVLASGAGRQHASVEAVIPVLHATQSMEMTPMREYGSPSQEKAYMDCFSIKSPEVPERR